jgi:4-amino-4-deoxy-L-arabinose transferase-like glycosyltransferase
MKPILNKYLKDIRVWILLFFLIRLIGITNPPLEISHNWRQSFTNTVARNFLEVDNNIFYPRAVIFGNNNGVLGTEFPFFNYLIYVISKIFGYAHWYGRLINLIISSIGIYFFYKIINKFLKPEIAFNSAIVLLCSVWFMFSRKAMPDTFSISLVIIGIYFGLDFLFRPKFISLILFTLFASLGVLSKIPGLYLLSVFIIPVFNKEIRLNTKVLFCLSASIILILMSCWYFYWVPYLESIAGNKLYFPKGFKEGLTELISLWNLTLERFYFSSMESFIGFAFFLAGIFFLIKKKEKLLLQVLAISSFVFFLFMIKTGEVFSLHSYYVVPFTPIMAVVTGYAISLIKKNNFRIIIISIIVIEAIANQYDDFFLKDSELYKLKIESIADKISDKKDLIAITGGQNPEEIYFAHRNGWRITNEQLNDSVFINKIINEGCQYLFINKNDGPYELNYKLPGKIYVDENFIIYSYKK